MKLVPYLTTAVACGAVVPSGHAADDDRARRIAAELDLYRRPWTICTVNQVGRAVEAGQGTDAAVIADEALARCAAEEQTLRTKAIGLLGAEAGERLMERLKEEAREALIGSARTLGAATADGHSAEPAWPRVLGPAR